MYVYVYIYIYIYTHTQCCRPNIYVHSHINTDTHTRARAHTHAHTHMQNLLDMLHVFFAKEPYKRDLYFTKETIFSRSLLIVCRIYWTCCCGVATISRLIKITCLFCKRALQKRSVFYKRDQYF